MLAIHFIYNNTSNNELNQEWFLPLLVAGVCSPQNRAQWKGQLRTHHWAGIIKLQFLQLLI